jgi:CubicO group peptidase (beta-lactamase class C family)
MAGLNRARLLMRAICCTLLTAFSAVTAASASPEVTAPELTAVDLASFMDGLMPYALSRGNVAGGVISVVKDDKILFAKGYGYADLKTHTPMSPDDSLIRPGSISKLFTWTAVMQLVEQQKLDLDVDVNEYLDFAIPRAFGKPITLRNLMTHTAGFEEAARGTSLEDPASFKSFDFSDYLKTHLPARIFPPGEITAYSNYGCALAGYIVQRISGERFEDYIAVHILRPLGMTHTTFDQPLPPNLLPLMSQGYLLASSAKPVAFELMTPPPPGGLTSSAADMAHFMLAHLDDGRYGDARILEAHTAQLMHSQQVSLAPGLNGVDLGFYQEDRNGLRIIGHGGDLLAFHSDIHLLLDAHVGIFMSFNSIGNSGGADLIRSAVFRAFLDRYFPYGVPQEATAPSAKTDALRVAGWYLLSRRAESGLRALHVLLQVEVQSMPDGTIRVPALTDLNGTPKAWREVGPLRYREAGGQGQLAFVTTKSGDVRYWTTDEYPSVLVFQRISGLATQGATAWLTGLAGLTFLIALSIWILGYWVRKHYDRPLALFRTAGRMRLASRLAVLCMLVLLLDWVAFLLLGVSASSKDFVDGGDDHWLFSLYVLGAVALIGVAATLTYTVMTWVGPRRGLLPRLGEGILAVAALYVAWLIVFYRLVDFSFKY